MSGEIEIAAAEPAPAEPAPAENNTPDIELEPTVVESEPVAPISTLVSFEITVPVIQSDALSLQLDWGDTNITARWIGDQLWMASAEFPTNTTNTLSITFFDGNGSLAIASFEQEYTTGETDSELFQVGASQFDTDRLDSDNDGDSNINELNAGTDPLVDESTLIDLRETFLNEDRIVFRAGEVESMIPSDRPYFENTEIIPDNGNLDVHPEFGLTSIITIDIDESGSGSFSDFQQELVSETEFSTITTNATRDKREDAVSIRGTYEEIVDGESIDTSEFFIETWIVDEQTRGQVGDDDTLNSNVERFIIYGLVGRVIEGTDECEPISGDVIEALFDDQATPPIAQRTAINKTEEDEFWSVVTEALDGEILEEYFVRSLGATFYCGFEDL